MIVTNLKKTSLFFLVTMLVLSSMACLLSPKNNTENPVIQDDPINNEPNEVETLLTDLQSQTGSFAFSVTEEEMASYLTLKMNENQAEAPVENLQVMFQENQITLAGDVFAQNLGVKVPVEIGIVAKVDETGQLYFELVSVKVANLKLPQTLEQSLSAAFTDLMNSQFANYLSGYKIDTVFVNAGLLTISGEKR